MGGRLCPQRARRPLVPAPRGHHTPPPHARRTVAQPPQPRTMRRHALDRFTHRPQRPQRPRIDTERHRLTATPPAADVCPVIDRARSQHLGIARREGAPDCPLYRPAVLGRSARPFAQVRMLSPFHGGVGDRPVP
jgi:hypothetical protein